MNKIKPITVLKARVGGHDRAELRALAGPVTNFISPWAEDVLVHGAWAAEPFPTEVSFALVSVRELGLERSELDPSITTEMLLDSAMHRRLGITPCQPGDALYLRRLFVDQGEYEWAHVVHKPLRDSFGSPLILSLGKDGAGLRIDARNAARFWHHKFDPKHKNQYLFFRML